MLGHCGSCCQADSHFFLSVSAYFVMYHAKRTFSVGVISFGSSASMCIMMTAVKNKLSPIHGSCDLARSLPIRGYFQVLVEEFFELVVYGELFLFAAFLFKAELIKSSSLLILNHVIFACTVESPVIELSVL
jgi:hypothetical protein